MKKDLSEMKRKYHAFRHHAWAGLGFLSVILAFRLILLESAEYLTPVIVILAIYIFVALIFTYRYSAGLSAEEKVVHVKQTTDNETDNARLDLEKEKIKLEKKKAKAEAKKEKKSKK